MNKNIAHPHSDECLNENEEKRELTLEELDQVTGGIQVDRRPDHLQR
jgi:hypothetical protein